MTTIEAPPATIETLPDGGPDELLRRLGAAGPRELYDALVRRPGSRPELDRRLEVVAMPNERAEELRADDLFVRVALGEGHGLLSVLVTGELLDRPAAERRGWQLEGTLPGRYAHVVEGGARPHAREEDWARRIADRDGYLPPGHAVLRLKGPLPGITATGSVDAQTERALIEQGAPSPPGSGAPAPAAAATFALLLDADRNGSADTSAPLTATWTWGASGRGAIVLVNNDDDGVNGAPDNADGRIDGGTDAGDLAPLTIARTSAGTPPAGTQVDLIVDRPDVLRIFSGRTAGGAEVIGPGTAATFRLPSLAAARFELGMEAVRYAGTGFSGEVRITLRVTAPGGTRKDSTAVVRVAPWMMPSHLSRAETVFVVDRGSTNATYRARMRTLVTAAGCRLVEVPNPGDIWAQDCMEFGFASLPGAALRTVLRSPQPRALKVLPRSLLNTDLGLAEVGTEVPETTFDSTGNLECSPPVTSAAGKRYPFGRILFGPGIPLSEPIDDDLKEFLRRQVVQEPIEVDTQWLAVGHVDEILSFVPAPGAKGFRLLMPSPRVAYALLDALKAIDPGAKILPGRAFPYRGHPDSPVEQTVSAFLALRDDFLPELRDRIAAGRVTHTPKPLRDYNADRQRNLDAVKATLKAGLGLADADIVELPAVFMPNSHYPWLADALIPGMVNMLVLNRHCIVPKPFGPQGGGPPKVDLFEDEVLKKLAPLGLTVSFLDCWSEYHVLLGEVHCSSNTLRSAAPARWWEFKP